MQAGLAAPSAPALPASPEARAQDPAGSSQAAALLPLRAGAHALAHPPGRATTRLAGQCGLCDS